MSERKTLKIVSPMMASSPSSVTASEPPDPEVRAMAKRQHCNAGDKVAMPEEADRCATTGAIWALLTREGLSNLRLAVELTPRKQMGELRTE